MDWQKRAIELCPTTKVSIAQASILSAECFPNENIYKVQQKVRSFLRRYYAGKPTKFQSNTAIVSVNEDITPKLTALLKNGGKIGSIAESLKVSERVAVAMIDDLIDKGHCVEETDGIYKLSNYPQDTSKTVIKPWNGEKIVRLGLTGDFHFGSKFVQITHMNAAYDFFKSEGVQDVYNTGDLTDGENMRPGHAYECYVHGADDHIAEVIKNYPKRDGVQTHYILGNHDASFIKHVGLNIGKQISNERKDMTYLGLSQAFIDLTPNCKLELRHPGGGSAYAISYKPQKMADAMSGGEKPNVLAIGHLHKLEYLFYRNIHIFQTGTLQAQSTFMRDNSLAAHMGCWILTIYVNDDGEITRIVPEMKPFYKAIVDDYKNFR